MSDALAKARATAAAATPGGVCAGPAPPQTAHRDTPQRSCPECGPDLDVFYMTYDPPMVLAMLDVIEAADVACKQGRPVDAFQALNDVDDALRAFRDLFGGAV